MSLITSLLLFSWGSGIAAFFGGLFARHETSAESETKDRIIHGVVAFGGGILLAAVCFALLPRSMELLSPWVLSICFVAGGALFSVIDAYQSRKGGPRAQFLAMLMDFLPEALSLGAVFGHDHSLGLLLAAFIALQNLPEGFNAYREMVLSGARPWTVLGLLAAISLLGPAAAITGHLFLQDLPLVTATIMVFASGGILYLIFQDIAPQSRMERHWSPTLGAVLGFLLGMLGHILIH
ncbi:MAG: hypothetical protein KDK23_07330 [Leptospiraceae bacterium]|nr:hypothetical protein [Leptospiraceae bacterium]